MKRRWMLPVVAFVGAVLVACTASPTKPEAVAAATAPTGTDTPVRAAFYYPWFPETWHATDKYHPTLGKYDSSTQAVIDQHMSDLAFAGEQAAIVSWWGQGTHKEQTRFPALQTSAATHGLTVAPYYEKEGTTDTPLTTIQSDLTYLKAYEAANPGGFLHVNGKPVIFVYNSGAPTANCATVSKWKTATNGFTDWYVNMKVFTGYKTCADQPSSWHQYAPASAVQSHLPYSYNVSPGFNQYAESAPRLARDLARFKTNLADQVTSGAKWQLVTSFNEWGEGTAVEPATEWSSPDGRGDYLDAMHGAYGATQAPTVTPTATPTPTPTPTPAGKVSKVLVFIEENHSLAQMQAGMPYAYSLAKKYGYATNYTASRHPSLPNYLSIAGGDTFGVADDAAPTAHPLNAPSVFGQAIGAGKTAKLYADGMPANCSLVNGGTRYAVKHNPWAYFTPTAERTACKTNDVPETKLQADVAAGTLPNVGMVVPNLCNDAHDCSLTVADNWFKTRMTSILAGPDWKAGRLAVVLTADEDDNHSGNKVLTVVVHPSQAARVVTTPLSHYSLTRLLEDVAGVAHQRNATTAPNMATAFHLPLAQP